LKEKCCLVAAQAAAVMCSSWVSMLLHVAHLALPAPGAVQSGGFMPSLICRGTEGRVCQHRVSVAFLPCIAEHTAILLRTATGVIGLVQVGGDTYFRTQGGFHSMCDLLNAMGWCCLCQGGLCRRVVLCVCGPFLFIQRHPCTPVHMVHGGRGWVLSASSARGEQRARAYA